MLSERYYQAETDLSFFSYAKFFALYKDSDYRPFEVIIISAPILHRAYSPRVEFIILLREMKAIHL
jgi:hypothetical protein